MDANHTQYLTLALVLANVGVTVFYRRTLNVLREELSHAKEQIAVAKNRFKVNFSALKHDIERECSICNLKVVRYVPDETGAQIACANCIGEGRVDRK